MTSKNFKAGPFSVLYENGFLRYIRYGESEIVRMIYFALRDEHWATLEVTIANEQVTSNNNTFNIQYECSHQRDGVNVFVWKVSVHASADGEIVFEIEGKALTDLLKNRAGFCILHPLRETAGSPCMLIHPDGHTSTGTFPEFIAPQNPFKNVKAMRWNVDGHAYRLDFEGDIFETEDQRNWSDSSFKTFCTPLENPVPVLLRRGDKVHQRVTFRPEAALSEGFNSSPIRSLTTAEPHNLPTIGIAASTETDVLAPEAIRLLKELKLSHYRIEVRPTDENWKDRLLTDTRNASQLELPLEIALHLTDNFEYEWNAFVNESAEKQMPIKTLILLGKDRNVTDQAIIDRVPSIKAHMPSVLVGAGTDYNFAQLNQNRFKADVLDFVTFSIHPQEHAFDDLSIMETLESHADLVKSARHMYPGAAVHVSPVTLRKRYNP
ncbi:MAG TPA: hypothetical protein VD816_08465, partial [Ohtaekwangia sp.]|nr:hypothetical protein [Ohtaekwangia sp.]